VAVVVGGSRDCVVGVSGEGEEMFVKLTVSTMAATVAATPAQKRLQQDTRHHMNLMVLMVAVVGRHAALRWCCERRKRKYVCQTYRVFDGSNASWS
jgi:cytochrome b561